MNKKELLDRIHTLIFCTDDGNKTSEEFMWDIENCVDKYVDKYVESQKVCNKKIVINSLLHLGQSISEVHRLAFNISELLKVEVEFNFNGVEMTDDNKTSFEDFKEEFIERVSILHV